jgi:hypothetical protein
MTDISAVLRVRNGKNHDEWRSAFQAFSARQIGDISEYKQFNIIFVVSMAPERWDRWSRLEEQIGNPEPRSGQGCRQDVCVPRE